MKSSGNLSLAQWLIRAVIHFRFIPAVAGPPTRACGSTRRTARAVAEYRSRYCSRLPFQNPSRSGSFQRPHHGTGTFLSRRTWWTRSSTTAAQSLRFLGGSVEKALTELVLVARSWPAKGLTDPPRRKGVESRERYGSTPWETSQ